MSFCSTISTSWSSVEVHCGELFCSTDARAPSPPPQSSNDVASNDATELILNNFPASGCLFCLVVVWDHLVLCLFAGGGSTSTFFICRRVTRGKTLEAHSASQEDAFAAVGNTGVLVFKVMYTNCCLVPATWNSCR